MFRIGLNQIEFELFNLQRCFVVSGWAGFGLGSVDFYINLLQFEANQIEFEFLPCLICNVVLLCQVKQGLAWVRLIIVIIYFNLKR